jgi:hypothetical protein
LKVLVLYLDRPRVRAERGIVLLGRFRYSDLKEAALSGAAVLWALNRLELVTAAGDVDLVAF